MEITHRVNDGWTELTIAGRLDGYWADHLDRGLADTVRDGHHRLRLNLANVTFLSSAGIGVVVKFYKRLTTIKGALVITSPSQQVRTVLRMTNLTDLLLDDTRPTALETSVGRMVVRGRVLLQQFDLETGSPLTCEVSGNSTLIESNRSVVESATLRCPPTRFALGIGAFGATEDECRERFGEFIAVAGAAAYLPGDGTEVPDYLVASDAHAPELRVLRSIACDGSFAHQVRFEPTAPAASVSLSELASAALDIVGGGAAGLVIVAETDGLVGASLRQSPAAATAGEFFAFPEVRTRLTFAAERSFPRSLVLVAGVVQRPGGPIAEHHLRPMAREGTLMGHFHAAAFPFHSFKKGRLDLKATVRTLFDNGGLLGVLHLVNDDRPIVGIGESDFTRGACWVGPIHTVAH
jgi:anti-anti-sigma factor